MILGNNTSWSFLEKNGMIIAINPMGMVLEMIDPYNPCSGKNNWLYSVHENGGTPDFQIQ
jgi:hypothetical protein